MLTSNQRSGLWAVVPVKLLAQTKRRLMPLLSSEEREGLACAMLEDVLTALTHASSLAGIAVVTGDVKAAAIARAAGATLIVDDENAGMTAAVTKAARHLAGAGREGMLVIPADVPLIASADVELIAAAHRTAPSVTLVPAGMDGGTNALAASPPEACSFCFGVDSFTKHLDASRACDIEPQIVHLASLAQDIDRPDDLSAFLSRSSRTKTYAYLSASGIARRLAPGNASARESMRSVT